MRLGTICWKKFAPSRTSHENHDNRGYSSDIIVVGECPKQLQVGRLPGVLLVHAVGRCKAVEQARLPANMPPVWRRWPPVFWEIRLYPRPQGKKDMSEPWWIMPIIVTLFIAWLIIRYER